MAEVERHTIVHTGLASSAVATRTAVRSWICRVSAGPHAGQELAIGSRPLVVGAHRSCDLILANDPKVSRRHAELCGEAEGVRVRDLDSTNGVLWQGSRIHEAVVPIGASIELGATTLRLLASPAPVLPPSERTRFGGLVGRSAAMRELFAVLELASPTDATIVLQGESGTGKEVAARAVHDHSSRASGSFVVVDCSAISEHLVESHLFGHKKGAFTGAAADRRGAFVEAHGGTLFLDELGELPLPLQAKLLRALEQRQVVPVGSDKPVDIDVRVIAATHRDLYAMVQDKSFRFDLFHRLAVVHVFIPPLREHLEDLPELVEAFYQARGVKPRNLEGPNLEFLARYPWPGNVRELRNALERAWALSGSDGADFASLRLWLHPAADPPALEAVDTNLPFKEAKERWVERFERRYLAAVFAAHDRNITRAAEHAGIQRRHFRELLIKHDLRGE
jgi:two-component system, NtrC family, nitrogen regulation response regulator GlnG